MHVDRGVGEGVALALCAGAEQDGTHAGGNADSEGMNRRIDHLHRVIDGQAGVDQASRAVDEHLDRLIRILGVQVEELGDDQVGDLVGERHPKEDDALLEQEAVDIVGAFAAAGALDDHGNDIGRSQAARRKRIAGETGPISRFSFIGCLRALGREFLVKRIRHGELPFTADDFDVDRLRIQPVARPSGWWEQCIMYAMQVKSNVRPVLFCISVSFASSSGV